MKKYLSSALLLLLVAAQLMAAASCGGSESSDGNVTTANDLADTTTAEPVDEREAAKDNVPADLDFGGGSVRILYHDGERYARDIIAEEENGEVVNDAVYARNTAVEERLNVVLEPIGADASSFGIVNVLRPSVLAGSDDYDIVCSHAIRTAAVAPEGLLYNLFDIDYLDFDKPWWNQNAVDQLAIDGRMYITIGDYSTLTLGAAYCMYFNKELAETYGITAEKLYGNVLDGNWTYDALYAMVSDFAKDLDGDTEMGEKDQYGLYTTPNSPAVTYNWAFGNMLTRKGSDGYPELNLDKSLMSEIIEKVYALYYDNDGTYVSSQVDDYTMFEEGRVLFYNGTFNDAFSLRDLNFSYGIIPYPKLNAGQERYLTMADGFHTVLCIPSTCTETDKVGATLELLNFYSYKNVVPAYYETALKVKYTSDDESMQIMDLILDGRVFDFGYYYDNWKGFAFMVQDLMRDKNNNFSSYYASRENAAISYFNEVIDSFKEIE